MRIDELVGAPESILVLQSDLGDDIEQFLPLPVAFAAVLELDELLSLPQAVQLFLS